MYCSKHLKTPYLIIPIKLSSLIFFFLKILNKKLVMYFAFVLNTNRIGFVSRHVFLLSTKQILKPATSVRAFRMAVVRAAAAGWIETERTSWKMEAGNQICPTRKRTIKMHRHRRIDSTNVSSFFDESKNKWLTLEQDVWIMEKMKK